MTNQIIDPRTGRPMDTSGAKPVLGDDQLRAKQAAEEIRVILEAYDAELFPVIMLSPRGVVGVTVDILPKKRPEMPMTREVDSLEASDEAADVKEEAPAADMEEAKAAEETVDDQGEIKAE
jgi:hypothetical protein